MLKRIASYPPSKSTTALIIEAGDKKLEILHSQMLALNTATKIRNAITTWRTSNSVSLSSVSVRLTANGIAIAFGAEGFIMAPAKGIDQ